MAILADNIGADVGRALDASGVGAFVGRAVDAIPVDTDLSQITLDILGTKKGDINVTGSVLDARVRETMTGAPTFTLILHDPSLALLRSGNFFQKDKDGDLVLRDIEVDVAGRPYMLAKLAWSPATSGAGVDLTLTFEHKVVWALRQHKSKRKVSRKTTTLAMFIRTFAREVKAIDIRFVTHELKTKNIARTNKTKEEQDEDKDEGFAAGAEIKVKGRPATARQKKLMEQVFQNGLDLGARKKVLIAANMTVTQESGWTTEATNGVHVGLFQQNPAYWPATRDPIKDSTAFFKKIIANDKKNPNMSLTALIESVQGSGQASLYGQWEDEAISNVEELTGTGTEGGGRSRTIRAKYNYERGVDGKKESSWDCSQRYAQLVNYRSFVTGKNTWYFDSEPKLFKQRPRVEINENNPAVLEVSGDIDTGKEAQQLTVRVLTKLWTTPAGCVAIVKGYGPADGRWLVEDYERSLYSTEGTVTLKKPTKPKPEPDAPTRTINEGGNELGDGDLSVEGSTKAIKLYRVMQIVSDRSAGYVYGGNHGPPFSAMSPSDNFDCSSSCSYVLDAVDLFQGLRAAITSGIFASSWGKPGRGKIFTVWANSEHVFIQWEKSPGSGKRFDTSPHAGDVPSSRGPRLRNQTRSTAGFTPRHWPGF